MNKDPQKKLSTAEFLAKLEADPEFVARRQRQEEERRLLGERIRAAEAPLLADLEKLGGEKVNSVWDLVSTRRAYPKAISVLLAHLERDYPNVVRAGIARALGVPEARASGWDVLVKSYRAEVDEEVKSGLAVALLGSADDSVLDDVLALIRDPSHGKSRGHLVDVLVRSKERRAWEALEALASDQGVAVIVGNVLRKRRKRRKE
jgi:HEAT repeat protein